MDETPEPSIPATTGIKRKADPSSYDELREEVKILKSQLKESKNQYNAVVPKYNKLWRQAEKHKEDYRVLADKNQGLVLENNTLRSIAFFSD
jgi:molecular chaperone GrpE (heat shock protein)